MDAARCLMSARDETGMNATGVTTKICWCAAVAAREPDVTCRDV